VAYCVRESSLHQGGRPRAAVRRAARAFARGGSELRDAARFGRAARGTGRPRSRAPEPRASRSGYGQRYLLAILFLANVLVGAAFKPLWGNEPSCRSACQEIGAALVRVSGDRKGCTCFCAWLPFESLLFFGAVGTLFAGPGGVAIAGRLSLLRFPKWVRRFLTALAVVTLVVLCGGLVDLRCGSFHRGQDQSSQLRTHD
jgi:hypothetical protein